jgi:glycosyltransferase involved in cell wall biosynthesis
MKICIVSSFHLEVTAPYIDRLQNSHEVDFYVPMNNADRNIFLFDIDATRYGNRTGFLNEDETRTALGSHGRYFAGLRKLWFFLYPNSGFASPGLYACFIKLALHIRKQNYDVIHVIGQFPFLLFIHLLNKGKARVHTLHESVPHSGVFPWHEKLMLRSIAKLDVQLIFPSETTKRRFLEYTGADPARCHRIFFGIVENYRSFIRQEIRENKNQVLLFGFINSYKGVEYLAEAAPLIHKIVKDLRVVIAGRWSLPDLKDKLKSDPLFTIIDKSLSNEEMTTLIQESGIVVCPYTSASNSGVVMTAFVFNKPVIASNLDGLAEVIENNKTGILVNPRDPQALATAITHLLTHEEERKAMKNNIMESKEHSAFSWDHITRQTTDVYELALKSSQ